MMAISYSSQDFRFLSKGGFHLQKMFRGQEQKSKFSSERNGTFSFANFRISIQTGMENSVVNMVGLNVIMKKLKLLRF